MRYLIDENVLGLRGEPLRDVPGPEGKELTYRVAMLQALLSAHTENTEEKYKVFKLALRLTEHPTDEPIELNVDDAKRIRDSAQSFNAVGYGRLVDFLENPNA